MIWKRVSALACSWPARLFLLSHLLIVCSFGIFGWDNTWLFFDFAKPPLEAPFLDLWTIRAAPEAMALGLDPLVNNPTEFTGLVMNYPRIWAHAANYVQLNDMGVMIMGTVLWLLFVISVLMLIDASGPNTRNSKYVVTLALMPASWFVLIEGNNDLLIFFLTVVCCRFFATSRIFSLFVVGLATVLKIYPIVVFPVFLHRSNGKAVNAAIVAACLLCVAYLLFQLSDLHLMRAGNTASANYAYGFGSLWSIPKILPRYEAMLWPMNKTSEFIFFLIFATGAAAIAAFGLFSRTRTKGDADPVIELFFLAGGALYIGTFILSANWDYRLVMLVLCAPYIATMPRSQRYLTLGAAVLSMNFWSVNSIGQFISGSDTRVSFILMMFVQTAKCLLLGLLSFEFGKLARRRLLYAPISPLRASEGAEIVAGNLS
jgi:hypothetical protein